MEDNQPPKMVGIEAWLNQDTDDFGVSQQESAINAITESLAEVNIRMQLEEYKFREAFLPFFLDTPIAERKYKEVNLGHWRTVAGGNFNEVDVVDEHGVVVFTVPPIADRLAMMARTASSGLAVSDLVQRTSQLANQSPHAASKILASALRERTNAFFNKANILKHIEAWNKIYAYYNLPPLLDLEALDKKATGKEQKAGQAQEPASDDSDDWEIPE
jgi:hypothetical protein